MIAVKIVFMNSITQNVFIFITCFSEPTQRRYVSVQLSDLKISINFKLKEKLGLNQPCVCRFVDQKQEFSFECYTDLSITSH